MYAVVSGLPSNAVFTRTRPADAVFALQGCAMKYALSAILLAIAAPALAQAGPISFAEAGNAPATSKAFANQIAARYAAGSDYAAAKADVERNGFRCEAPNPAGMGVTHECVRTVVEAGCKHEWAVELRQSGGVALGAANGSFAVLCVGAVLPPKHPPAYRPGN